MAVAAQSTPGADLTSDRLLLALVLGVATRREQTKRKDRCGSLIEECLDMMRRPELDPKIVRMHQGRDPISVQHRQMITDAHATLIRIAPLVHAFAALEP